MIYIHIPFCKTHCLYCGFYSELLRDTQGSEAFVNALLGEIECERVCSFANDTLYVGGGTPSVLTVSQLQRIVEALGKGITPSFDEFTLEVNPDDIVRGGIAYADQLRKLGVNRISMGVQSFEDAVLRQMGRRHRSADVATAMEILRDSGFDNVSIDLIFGFVPKIDIALISERLVGLHPEHVSCYQLSVEEGSPLEKMMERDLFQMPSDEQCAGQYEDLCSLLHTLGYEHYEISNWALPSRRARHNGGYWNHTPYLGLGPGAHSLFVSSTPEGAVYLRRWNNPDLAAYIRAAAAGDFSSVRGCEQLTDEQIRDERIMLGLRTVEGIDGESIPEDKWFIADSLITDMICKR